MVIQMGVETMTKQQKQRNKELRERLILSLLNKKLRHHAHEVHINTSQIYNSVFCRGVK